MEKLWKKVGVNGGVVESGKERREEKQDGKRKGRSERRLSSYVIATAENRKFLVVSDQPPPLTRSLDQFLYSIPYSAILLRIT